ncbi:hypothetical protein ACQ4PT_067422 [Festuca glaucescens]
MAYRVLEVTLMEVYAVATIAGYPITRQCTPPDPHGGCNPTWNAMLWFAVPPMAKEATGGCLHILLRIKRMFGADRDVGEVIVPLAELFTAVGCSSSRYEWYPCGSGRETSGGRSCHVLRSRECHPRLSRKLHHPGM